MRRILAALAVLTIVPSCSVADPDLPIAPHLDHDEGVMMQAELFGRLAVRHTCLVVLSLTPDEERPTVAFTPIWNHDAEVGRDTRGIYVRSRSSGAIIRPGDRVSGGGGFIASDPPYPNDRDMDPNPEVRDRAWVNRRVTPDLPPACGGDYATFHSFEVLGPRDPQ